MDTDRRIFWIDMDGTIVDFMSGFYRSLNEEVPPATTYNLEREYGLHAGYIDDLLSDDFFFGLDPLPWADDLIAACRSVGEVRFVTSPTPYYQGKLDWINTHAKGIPMYMCDEDGRAALANPRDWLLDDFRDNVLNWRAKGGRSILMPASYNPRGIDIRFAIDYISNLDGPVA